LISDKLFLAWNCSDCTRIKAYIVGAMFNDDIKGNNGQILTVVHTFSNDGTRNILDIFGIEDNHAPALLTHDEKIIADADEIISYLQENGLAIQK